MQGEGARAGEPSIFIRLAGCDLTCGFCDTEFESGREMSNDEILNHLAQWPCKWIVWTGGEPAMQINESVVGFFKAAGYKQAIETNGNHRVPGNLDWVTVSPKVAEHVLAKNFPNGVAELKYVRHNGQMACPQPKITAQFYFISPMFNGNQPDVENIKHCIKLCLKNPLWRLSLQQHKLWKIL